MFKIGSLFDGSGGFPLAASLCGGTPAWASEIEPYPIAVTKSRFPTMRHLGNVSEVNGAEIEPVDVITFGSPCQDLSTAGKRAGLKHEANGDEETTRSGLFMEAVRIIKEMREATNGIYPAFAIWENVPGALNSNKGEDFRTVIEELIKICEPSAQVPAPGKNRWPYSDVYMGDGWSLAYRVFNAQYWGVPQRRRRIYLVLHLRGECAHKVLFERQGLRGHFETGKNPWQGTPARTQRGANTNDRPIAFRIGAYYSAGMLSNNPKAGIIPTSISNTLDCAGGSPISQQGGVCIVERVPYTLKIRSGCEGGGKGALIQTDKSATILVGNDQYLFQPMAFGVDFRNATEYPEVNGALQAKPGGGYSENYNQNVRIGYIVRRFMPKECARLQGFPDTWGHPDQKETLTDEEYRFWLDVRNTHAEINGKAVKEYTREQMLTYYNKLHTDSSEYKMWGNGIALPNALYVMQGIADQLMEVHTHEQ